MQIGPFYVDDESSDDSDLYVDVDGLTVVVHRNQKGISAEIYPLGVGSILAHTWVNFEDITGEFPAVETKEG